MAGEHAALPVEPDEVVAGKYRIVREVARGGMGVVLEAVHVGLDQRVALKLLLPEAMQHPDARGRFEREARAAARLHSDHVARVFDVGALPDGTSYMVMEYLEGADLADELAARGRFPIVEAVDAVLQALEAIGEAHAAGIVHRDLKPSNLFRARKPDGARRIKVLDFGISKVITGQQGAAITATNALLGSPGYMSPEQVRSSKNVDARTDIWAIGVILHELLTGTMLFPGETVGDTFAKILHDPIPELRASRPDVPEALAAVIGKCLTRDREARFVSVAELRAALSPFASARQRLSLESLRGRAESGEGHGVAGAGAETLFNPEARAQSAPRPAATGATWTGARPNARGSKRGLIAAAGVVVGAVAVWLTLRALSPSVEARSPVAPTEPAGASASERVAATPPPPDVAPAPSGSPTLEPVAPTSSATAPTAATAARSRQGGAARPGGEKRKALPSALQGRD